MREVHRCEFELYGPLIWRYDYEGVSDVARILRLPISNVEKRLLISKRERIENELTLADYTDFHQYYNMQIKRRLEIFDHRRGNITLYNLAFVGDPKTSKNSVRICCGKPDETSNECKIISKPITTAFWHLTVTCVDCI